MAEQTEFPFPYRTTDLEAFLTRAAAIEDEMDRLREDLQELRQEYTDTLPLRGVTTALKVVRARRKLEDHPKEPMKLQHQQVLETEVERWLAHLDAEKERAGTEMATTGG